MNRFDSVYIPYETKARELDGRLLLAEELLHSGLQVFIGSRKGIRREIQFGPGSLLLAKSLSRNDREFLLRFRESGGRVAILHPEGGVYYRDMRESILWAYPPDMLDLCDAIFIYGEEIRKAIQTYVPRADMKKIFVTGEPRFDLLKKKYAPFFRETVDRYRRRLGEYVLINTNFGLANPYVGEANIRRFYQNSKDVSEALRKLILKKIDFGKKIVGEFIKMTRHLAVSFPSLTFVVRPHPSERQAFYETQLGDLANVLVSRQDNVQGWILGATMVIQYDCTTALEACLAGKPVVSFVPERDEEILAWLPVYVSKEVSNVEEVADFLREASGKDANLDEERRRVAGAFIHNFNEESVGFFAAIIADLFKDGGRSEHRTRKGISPRVQLERLEELVKYAVWKQTRKSIAYEKFGWLRKREILRKMRSIARIQGRILTARVSHCGIDVLRCTPWSR